MPNTDRLHQLLSRLQSFDKLYDAHQASILTWKNYFQIHDSKLRDCLDTLAVPQLEPYLVWIPFDDLEEFEQLAQGGFAKVYKARVWVNPIYHHVAAKEVKMSMAAELVLSIYLSRYGNTTQCAPTMEVFGLSQHQETAEYLMIMQFADLGTLEKYPCDVDDDWYTALTYATKLSSRLADLHEIGFTHQDLHPGNVVFHKSRTALLIDVGMSRAAEDSYSEDSIYGRIEYLPPETLEGKDYTQKSDVYCLGTLLWQLIVGVPPRYTALVAVRHNQDGLREELISDAPILFNSIIQSCWHLNPDQRPSAHDVYNQLIECAASLTGNSLTPLSNMEDEILGALAIKPTPFSTKTQSFISARRTNYQQKSNSSSINDDAIYSSTASMSYTGSNFYPRKQLEVIIEQHSALGKNKIDEPQINDDDPLKRKIALTELRFRAKNKGVDVLAKVLEHDSAMANVNLQDKLIDDKATTVLALFLKQNTLLTKLSLSKNNFGLLLTRTLAEFLKQDKTLTELNLGWNFIGDEGTGVLAESLKQNTTLNNLNLGGNGIGDEGVSSLAEALKQNTALVKLNLGDNRIGDNGASAIAKFLKSNTRLVELNLSLNCIGDHGFIDLAKYISVLAKLNISSNKIGNNGAIAVLEFLRNNNCRLTELDLHDNYIDDHLTNDIAQHNMKGTEWDKQSFTTIATETSISTTETDPQHYDPSRSLRDRVFPTLSRLPWRNYKISTAEKQYPHLDRQKEPEVELRLVSPKWKEARRSSDAINRQMMHLERMARVREKSTKIPLLGAAESSKTTPPIVPVHTSRPTPSSAPRPDIEQLPYAIDDNKYKVVIAIDFGTTFSGCTWAITGTTDTIKDVNRWPDMNGTYPKIPTAVIYNNGELQAWGQTAQNMDTFNTNRGLGGLQYFSNFKLYLDEKVARTSEPPQLPYGKTPVGIIADFLREMHKFVLAKIPNVYSRDQIRYCLTIPASWSPDTKRKMREAATMADMIKGGDPAERLLLVSEPEAAMIYVKEKQPGIEGCRNIMICDAGGGTVDMCTFAVSATSSTQKTLQEISLGHGKSCGSVFIDMAMEKYIREVKLGRQVCNEIHPRLVPSMMRYFIDNVKKNFRPETGEYPIPSPVHQDHTLREILPSGTVVDGIDMIFTFEELQKNVFDPVICEILALIRDQIRQLPAQSAPDRSSSYACDKLVLVGGFGESEYLLRKVQEEFMVPGLVRDVETVFNAGLAVVRGAAYFGLRPATVTQRFSRYSYGISVLRAFQPGQDPESKRVVGRDGAMRCDDSFFKYIAKGEPIQFSKTVTHEFATFHKERVVDVKIYAYDGANVPRYTDSAGVFYVGTVHIPQMPNINRVVDAYNPLLVKIHMYFGLMEIRATVGIERVNYVAKFDFKNDLVLNN